MELPQWLHEKIAIRDLDLNQVSPVAAGESSGE